MTVMWCLPIKTSKKLSAMGYACVAKHVSLFGIVMTNRAPESQFAGHDNVWDSSFGESWSVGAARERADV